MGWMPRRPRRPERARCLAQRWSRAPESAPRGAGQRPRFSALWGGEGRPARSVLIVDDDDFGREMLGRILEAGGYRVLRAADGAEALRHLRGPARPGLIILDLLMPRLDGRRFVCRQQRDPDLAGIPVIVVSADTSPLGEGFPGVVARFEKPVTVPELLAAIRRHLPG